MNNYQRLGRGAVFGGSGVAADEFDVVVEPDYLAARVRLDVPLGDLPRLVVEQAMGIAAPGHAAHVHPKSE